MPLVNIFRIGTASSRLPLTEIQNRLCQVWGTTPTTTKIIAHIVDDWTDAGGEDLFVSVRAKATPKRTREHVLERMEEVQAVFTELGYKANVRLETYHADAYFHKLPPGPK